MSPTIQRLASVKGRTGLGRTSIYNGVKAGTFPAPVHLGPRAVGWLESDITGWIEQRVVATRGASGGGKTARSENAVCHDADTHHRSGVAK